MESLQRLQSCFPDSAPSRTTVFDWFAEFKRNRQSLEDCPRSGRPSTAVVQENINLAERMILEDPRVTCRQIEHQLGIGSAAVSEILHQHLRVSKRCARWIPHCLTQEQKDNRVQWCQSMLERFDFGESKRIFDIVTGDETWVYNYDPETKRQSSIWCFADDDSPQKAVRSRSSAKTMVAAFFSRSGHLVTVPLQQHHTVTAQWYVNECVPQVLEAWCSRRPKTGVRGLLWHHDNAPAHTAAMTTNFLERSGVQLLPHPPYSPDLAPCDFFLFPKVKSQLKGRRFSSCQEAIAAYEEAVATIAPEEWCHAFTSWFRRMQMCIQAAGGYFEKL